VPGRPALGGLVAAAHAPSDSTTAATAPRKTLCLFVLDMIEVVLVLLRGLCEDPGDLCG
jgi:hypothetical protein